MAKPFDISKFRKDITKSIEGLSIGFNDPTDWISTGNYAQAPENRSSAQETSLDTHKNKESL
jgi:hypothetical protein